MKLEIMPALPNKHTFAWLSLAASLIAPTAPLLADDYYAKEPQFHMWPDPGAARYKISHFGPTGIGLELRQPNFTMHIVNIEEGSPAAATGELRKDQIIVSVNGHTMKDEDPRVLLGNWISEAEANDGLMKLMVKDDAKAAPREVIIKIPALGAYSPTWPVDCTKSDQIVRNHADALAANIDSAEIGLNGSVLFMLSTGEEKDLEVVRGWMKKFVENYKTPERETYPWFAGYTGPGFCEYYLRTGDEILAHPRHPGPAVGQRRRDRRQTRNFSPRRSRQGIAGCPEGAGAGHRFHPGQARVLHRAQRPGGVLTGHAPHSIHNQSRRVLHHQRL